MPGRWRRPNTVATLEATLKLALAVPRGPGCRQARPVQDALTAVAPFPSRLDTPKDFAAKLVEYIVENDLLNGEVIGVEWAFRLAPK